VLIPLVGAPFSCSIGILVYDEIQNNGFTSRNCYFFCIILLCWFVGRIVRTIPRQPGTDNVPIALGIDSELGFGSTLNK
jgi:hypothetical protein